jgi:ATP-dependent DNA helicase DinG
MLSDELKTEIRTAYTQLLDAKNYQARYCQKQMIADIANTLGSIEVDSEGQRLTETNICVVEAGAGTGKTIAYAIAVLPIAKALGKTLVISTATVALQEQIVHIDLPDIMRYSGLDFSFTLAKGRRRYLCLSRLDRTFQENQSGNQTLAFYEDEMFQSEESHQLLYELMLVKLGRNEWDGDRDNWPEEIKNSAWFPVSTDHVQCTGRQCAHYENCYFYRAREKIHRVDCIVTNHDLVMSDMMLGGGAVLPAPEDTVYIFDEGHHLPDKAINHFSFFIQVRSTQGWLEQLPGALQQLTDELGEIGGLPASLIQFENASEDLIELLEQAKHLLDPLREQANGAENDLRYRFAGGEVGPQYREMSESLYDATGRLLHHLSLLQSGVESELSDGDASVRDKDGVEVWVPVVAGMTARVESAANLWHNYMLQDVKSKPPSARWINFREGDEVVLQSSPIAVSEKLHDILWSRCFGAVVTSATLAVGNDFSRLQKRTGITADNCFRALQSPFRFSEQATLRIPKMQVDPRDADDHSDAVADLLPDQLSDVKGALVLFSSWRQMYRVSDALPGEFMDKVLSQGTFSKAEIVSRHKALVDAGDSSVIFGLASFAEGIDLPGEYCQHMVVVKIPFAVPDDPVGATLSEWIEDNGGNSFQEVMIPDAALRMVQACGRLLRTETDTGVVTIFDRRLVTQRYGNLLLNALPPFRREIS